MNKVAVVSNREMQTLESKCKELLRKRIGTRVSTTYWDDGSTYHGRIIGSSDTGLKIKFEDDDVYTLPARYIRVGSDYRQHDYVAILIQTALDFQMHVEVVNKALSHSGNVIPNGSAALATLITLMNRCPNDRSGNTQLAQKLWGYNHWSRAEFLRMLVARFEAEGVRDYEGLVKWLTDHDFDEDVKGKFRAGGHSVGLVIYKWMCLRCGLPTVKADVHILKFVEEAIGRRLAPGLVTDALNTIALSLKRPHHELDSAIWHAVRDRVVIR